MKDRTRSIARTAARCEPAYRQLRQDSRGSPQVVPDETGWRVGNVDITLVGQRPRIGPHRARMTATMATLLGVDAAQVNLKATTTDGLGFTGRGEGLACLAVVLLAASLTDSTTR